MWIGSSALTLQRPGACFKIGMEEGRRSYSSKAFSTRLFYPRCKVKEKRREVRIEETHGFMCGTLRIGELNPKDEVRDRGSLPGHSLLVD